MLDTQAWWAYVPLASSAAIVYPTFFVLARRAHQLAMTDGTHTAYVLKLQNDPTFLPVHKQENHSPELLRSGFTHRTGNPH